MTFARLAIAASFLIGVFSFREVTYAILSPAQEESLRGILKDRGSARWPELSTNQLAELRLKAEEQLVVLRRQHLPGGLIASVKFGQKDVAKIESYVDLENSVAWTGFYLAAMAFRQSITNDSKGARAFEESLSGIDRLLNASGRDGYVCRFAGRADDPAFAAVYKSYGGADPSRPGFGRWAFPAVSSNQVWLGNSDRDQYSGLNFGLAMLHEMVRDRQIRERAAGLSSRMTRRLILDRWRIDDGQGNVTFATPLVKLTLLRTAATLNPKEFGAAYEEYVRQFPDLGLIPIPAVQRYGNYSASAFAMANLVTLCRYETNFTRRLVFQDKCTQLWRQGQTHLNGWFAAGYASAYRTKLADPSARSTLQGVSYVMASQPRTSKKFDYSRRDELVLVTAERQQWSTLALPTTFLPPSPFIWAVSPFELTGGNDDAITYPGLDFLVPFWLGRESGLIPGEDEIPFDEWTKPVVKPRNTPNPIRQEK